MGDSVYFCCVDVVCGADVLVPVGHESEAREDDSVSVHRVAPKMSKPIPIVNSHRGEFVADIHRYHVLMEEDDAVPKRVLRKIKKIAESGYVVYQLEVAPT